VTRALYTMLAAVIVMITVPVSQLRTIAVTTECCCPDPTRCIVVGSSASEVVAAPMVIVAAPALRVATAEYALRSPHAPPSPARPPGPS